MWQSCLYENTQPPIHLQMGLIRHFAYIMASFKHVGNCNGTGAVSRIVMTFFENVIFIMA
jgi:hypothetical protein